MDDGCRGAARCLDAVKPALRRRASRRARPSASGSASRTRASATASRRSPARSCASTADGTVEVRHCWTEMGQGVHTVAAAGRGRGARHRPRPHPGDRRHHPRARRRPDHRQPRHADGRGRGGRRVPRPRWPTAAALGVDYEGEYRVDWTNSIGDGRRAPGDPLDVRLRRAARGHRPRDRARSSGSSPPTTSAGP